MSSTQATGSTCAPLPYTSSRSVVSPINSFLAQPFLTAPTATPCLELVSEIGFGEGPASAGPPRASKKCGLQPLRAACLNPQKDFRNQFHHARASCPCDSRRDAGATGRLRVLFDDGNRFFEYIDGHVGFVFGHDQRRRDAHRARAAT